MILLHLTQKGRHQTVWLNIVPAYEVKYKRDAAYPEINTLHTDRTGQKFGHPNISACLSQGVWLFCRLHLQMK